MEMTGGTGYTGYTISPIKDGKDLSDFIDLPFELYRDDPFWVPPLRSVVRSLVTPGKHPFHEHGRVQHFLARSADGAAIGRITAIVNDAHNEYHSERTGFFGFLEARRDSGLFTALLDSAGNWLAKQGMDAIRGPMSFSTNEEVGLLVKGFDSSPAVMMPYNPSWYSGLIENAGFSRLVDLLAYRVDTESVTSERFARIAGLVRKRYSPVIRPISMREFASEMQIVRRIYNECWGHNWGFVPMTDNEFLQTSRELKLLLYPDFVPIVEVDGEPVAFAAAISDANQALKMARGSLLMALLRLKVPPFRVRPSGIRVLLLGVRDTHRGKGLESLLIDSIISSATARGFTWAELSWVLEDNQAMRRILERDLSAEQHKTYRVYERPLKGHSAGGSR
jgi:GNAT superfamily N-acetyltransferase